MIQTDVRIRLLRESLDEEQLIELQQGIGKGELAARPAARRSKTFLDAFLAEPSVRQLCQPRGERVDFGFIGCCVESRLASDHAASSLPRSSTSLDG